MVRAEGKRSVDQNIIPDYSGENKSSVSVYGAYGEAIPLNCWTRPEVSRRLRLPDFKTFGT